MDRRPRSSFFLALFCAGGVVGLLVACGRAEPPADPRPPQAGRPLDHGETAARIAKIQGAAMAGDEAAVREGLHALGEDVRRSMKVADPSRQPDPEAARIAAKRVDGVRSAVWVDPRNLLAIVVRNDARTYATIDAICLELEPLGDTLGIVVNLQSAAAANGDELEILSRDCQLPPGERALLHPARTIDAIAPEVRAQQRAQRDAAAREASEHARRQRESMEILERTTPEL